MCELVGSDVFSSEEKPLRGSQHWKINERDRCASWQSVFRWVVHMYYLKSATLQGR